MYFWYKFFTYLFYPFAPFYLYFRILKKKEDIKRFKEIISHQDKKMFSKLEPQGEKPTDEEFEKFDDFIGEFGYTDREDDWWTDRKGGYEVTFKYEGEEDDQKKSE